MTRSKIEQLRRDMLERHGGAGLYGAGIVAALRALARRAPEIAGADEALEVQGSDGDAETGEEQESAVVDVAVDQIEADKDNVESNEE